MFKVTNSFETSTYGDTTNEKTDEEKSVNITEYEYRRVGCVLINTQRNKHNTCKITSFQSQLRSSNIYCMLKIINNQCA